MRRRNPRCDRAEPLHETLVFGEVESCLDQHKSAATTHHAALLCSSRVRMVQIHDAEFRSRTRRQRAELASGDPPHVAGGTDLGAALQATTAGPRAVLGRFVKLGYFGINQVRTAGPTHGRNARLAESAGLESLWTGEP